MRLNDLTSISRLKKEANNQSHRSGNRKRSNVRVSVGGEFSAQVKAVKVVGTPSQHAAALQQQEVTQLRGVSTCIRLPARQRVGVVVSHGRRTFLLFLFHFEFSFDKMDNFY